MPAQDGAVRTLKLKGEWILEALENGQTRVTYEVNADPGGLLPAWLVNLGSRKLPLKTLKNMREQLKSTEAYSRARLIVKYSYNFEDYLSTDHPVFAKTEAEEMEAQKALKAYQSEARFP